MTLLLLLFLIVFLTFVVLFVDEPEYWWFELMVLLNKTMMCGGLVVLSPGSPSQVVCAVLIMMFHMLLVLKTAPYIKDSEDWSSFASSLGLTLIYVSALVKMLQTQRREEFDPTELSYAGILMDALPILCVSTVIAIMIFVDCGLWNMCRKRRGKSNSGGRTGSTSKVLPANGKQPLPVFENSGELREIRKEFGAESKEYTDAVRKAQLI